MCIRDRQTTDNIIRIREHFKATASGTQVTFTLSGGPTFVDTSNNVLSPVGGQTLLTNGVSGGSNTYTVDGSSTTTVLKINGTVLQRSDETVNKDLSTGEIEVKIKKFLKFVGIV